MYSFKDGAKHIDVNFPGLFTEIKEIIAGVDASKCKTKTSKEKTMKGEILYDPRALNAEFSKRFYAKEWNKLKVDCNYSSAFYTNNYRPKRPTTEAYREMDFIKNKLGVEVQFGKYAFMVYNVCAKMTIFKRLGHIEAGVEIVPIKELAYEMSSGVSYFEQFVWDMEKRGVADIDIPVLVLGVHI